MSLNISPATFHHLIYPFLQGDRGQTLLYSSTLALCTGLTTVNLLLDTQEHLARLGGNKFGIAKALDDQQRLIKHATCSRANLQAGRYYTLITSAFNHNGLGSYVGNMYILHQVGRKLRPLPFLFLFYGGTIVSNFLCLALDTQTHGLERRFNPGRRELGPHVYYAGASGGISALLAFFTCRFPVVPVQIGIGPVSVAMPFWLQTLGFAVYSVWAHFGDMQECTGCLGYLGGSLWGVVYFATHGSLNWWTLQESK